MELAFIVPAVGLRVARNASRSSGDDAVGTLTGIRPCEHDAQRRHAQAAQPPSMARGGQRQTVTSRSPVSPVDFEG